MKKFVAGCFMITFTFLFLAQCQQKQTKVVVPDKSNADLFVYYCARCHRTNGMGSPTTDLGINAPDIRKFSKNKEELESIISNGYGKMPSFGQTISKDTISMIASYVATKIEGSSSDIYTSTGLNQ